MRLKMGGGGHRVSNLNYSFTNFECSLAPTKQNYKKLAHCYSYTLYFYKLYLRFFVYKEYVQSLLL